MKKNYFRINAKDKIEKKNTKPNKNRQLYQEKFIIKQQLYCVKPDQFQYRLHRYIIAIRIKFLNHTIIGSGVLLSQNVILTAAHNIYDLELRQQMSKQHYQIYIGVKDGLAEIQKCYRVDSWAYPKQFMSKSALQSMKYDYALIKLKQRFFYEQYLSLSLPCNCVLNKIPDVQLNIYGYPGTQQNYSLQNKQGSKFSLNQYGLSQKNKIVEANLNKGLIYHIISTTNGCSGSPIVIDKFIIRVHIAGGNNNAPYNVGVLNNIQMLNNLESYCRQLEGDLIKINQFPSCSICKPIIQPRQLTIQEAENIYMNKHDQIDIENIVKAADFYVHFKQYEKGLKLYQKSLIIYNKMKDKEFHKSQIYYQIGSLYHDKLVFPQDKQLFKKSIEIYELVERSQYSQQAKKYVYIGDLNVKQNLQLAVNSYMQAAKIYQAANLKKCNQYRSILIKIGNAYYLNQRYQSASKYLELSLKPYQQLQFQKQKKIAQTLVKSLYAQNKILKMLPFMKKYKLTLSDIGLRI